MQAIKSNNLIYYLLFSGFIIYFVIIPVINNQYIKPKKFKQEFFQGYRSNKEYNKVSTKQINRFVDFLYDEFIKIYKDVDNFPKSKNYFGKKYAKTLLIGDITYLRNEKITKAKMDEINAYIDQYFQTAK